ncbi:MAG: hypothetical protein IPI66_02940 [Chitinophagaceae bacterium]|nr:hypothetical protein [Chitinophagaceae bacterium]MBL0055139.1 hypothetical protein [Chitinophagaceae bacterium]
MKKIFLFSLVSLICLSSFSQNDTKKRMVLDPTKAVYELEASCGTCQFKMKAKGCPLAVRFEGKPYLVEGTEIDDHGDAHGKDGFCNAIRKAKVQGNVVGDKFVVSYFELLPQPKQ